MISITIDPVTSFLMAVFVAWAFRLDARTRRIENFLLRKFKTFEPEGEL